MPVKTSLILSSLIAFSALAACAPVGGDMNGPATPALPSTELGQCKADAYRGYIGKNRSEVPAAPVGETRRVVCSTCAVTMDFNPDRVNIVYDTTSNLVTEVKCG
jgi:hypothetical protein